MANYDSADLLARLQATLQRPTTDDASSDASLYTLLSNAQIHVMDILAAQIPWANYGPPELLTTSDNGATYTFAAEPMGRVEIRESRTGSLLSPVSEYSGLDGYVFETGGQTIRWPDGRTRTFADGPYARYTKTPTVISASVQPVILPTRARMAVVYKAATEWALQGGLRDPSPYLLQFQQELWGDANSGGRGGIIANEQTKSNGSGARYDGRWWVGHGWVNG